MNQFAKCAPFAMCFNENYYSSISSAESQFEYDQRLMLPFLTPIFLPSIAIVTKTIANVSFYNMQEKVSRKNENKL